MRRWPGWSARRWRPWSSAGSLPETAGPPAAVLLGWGLQMAHFALVAPKGEDGNLWAVGLFVQAFFAAVALGLAVLAYVVANRLRSRSRG